MDSQKASASTNSEPSTSAHGLAKQRLASHPETTPEVLDQLCERGNAEVSERVAENANTTSETLDKLAEHCAAEVRGAVAENPGTSASTLETLAGDPNPDVRFRVAENHDAPIAILETLAEDENPYVVARAEDTLNSLQSVGERAHDLFIKEKFGDAEQLYQKLIVGLEEYLGVSHPEVGKALHQLAAVLAAQHRFDEAKALEVRANAILTSEGELS